MRTPDEIVSTFRSTRSFRDDKYYAEMIHLAVCEAVEEACGAVTTDLSEEVAPDVCEVIRDH